MLLSTWHSSAKWLALSFLGEKNMIPVIVSGGSGSRLWPVSRNSYPKQFCELFDKCLMQESIDRLEFFGTPYLLTVKSLEVLTRKIATEHSISNDRLIFEPFGRNTAPAIAYLCHQLAKKADPSSVVGIFPADHLIENNEHFFKVIADAEKYAARGEVVTVGITPSFPATGYGYIEVIPDEPFDTVGEIPAFKVRNFKEKPNIETATSFLAQKTFFWNAGMFIFRLDTMIENFKTLAPEIWDLISLIDDDLSNLSEVYRQLPSISMDYAIMEKLSSQICIPCDIGWSDVGSWDQLTEYVPQKSVKVAATKAKSFEVNAQNNYVFSNKEKVFGFVGCNDLIVADTNDATLICKRGESQAVKQLNDLLIKAEISEVQSHKAEEHRPWGKYEILADHSAFKVKTITVAPYSQLSYQSHEKRAEHWVVVSGQAQVVLNDRAHHLQKGEHIFIPAKSKHRMRNMGSEPLIFVEVQTGTYFGEDDIVRYQDDYQRM
jgi:mannose-1-phosphate guanylyltransferase/mannose-6-phosphate isomerase